MPAIHITFRGGGQNPAPGTLIGFSRQDGVTAKPTYYPSDWVDVDQLAGLELSGLEGWFAVYRTEDGTDIVDPLPILKVELTR